MSALKSKQSAVGLEAAGEQLASLSYIPVTGCEKSEFEGGKRPSSCEWLEVGSLVVVVLSRAAAFLVRKCFLNKA